MGASSSSRGRRIARSTFVGHDALLTPAFGGVTLFSRKTGHKSVVTIPGMKNGQSAQYAWLPGSTKLLIAATAALEQTLTSRMTVTGPPDPAGVVQVTGDLRDAGSTTVHEAVGTLDVHTGRLVWQTTLPAGYRLAYPAGPAGQSSGRHFLIQPSTSLKVFAWTPAPASHRRQSTQRST
ncbi:hypothetical protein GCM10025867_27330 [Frondihabitans sucicola]|uniref:Uncharacterized protein n=1 Tax=Frondihabitans sucicola TaxID=1268041 RepID=A0ABN6Y328_9MICO|nr:hypothetical protein [Frondihabitans sucicola]BDZ50492.1 hypothetical protein GCM10025867_27330 [Frondihabitans sucicola]